MSDVLDPTPLSEELGLAAEDWQQLPVSVRLVVRTLLTRLAALETRLHQNSSTSKRSHACSKARCLISAGSPGANPCQRALPHDQLPLHHMGKDQDAQTKIEEKSGYKNKQRHQHIS